MQSQSPLPTIPPNPPLPLHVPLSSTSVHPSTSIECAWTPLAPRNALIKPCWPWNFSPWLSSCLRLCIMPVQIILQAAMRLPTKCLHAGDHITVQCTKACTKPGIVLRAFRLQIKAAQSHNIMHTTVRSSKAISSFAPCRCPPTPATPRHTSSTAHRWAPPMSSTCPRTLTTPPAVRSGSGWLKTWLASIVVSPPGSL